MTRHELFVMAAGDDMDVACVCGEALHTVREITLGGLQRIWRRHLAGFTHKHDAPSSTGETGNPGAGGVATDHRQVDKENATR